MSKFQTDLNSEKILSEYLDVLYAEFSWSSRRMSDSTNQNRGIDLIIEYNSKFYTVDEKSQLHYINQELPTFAFELSYLKDGVLKKGWLFDEKKETGYYFLVTNIKLKNNKNSLNAKTDIQSLKITSVNREKLIHLLNRNDVDIENLEYLIYNIRETKAFGKHILDGLDNRSEGNVHFTQNLSEQPINLVLKLNYLVKMGVAKVIYPKK